VLGNSDRIHAIDLIEQLRHLHPATYQGWDTGRLANNLRDAGVVRSTIQVKIGGANRNGYHRADLETAATRYPTTGTSG
jgi:DNA segregation ATPase FtsK/SpoIIIE, S-DNA-T family